MSKIDPYRKIRAYHVGIILAITDWFTILLVLKWVAHKTATSVKLSYLGDQKEIEQDIRHGAFFITNHRDIIMDASWLSMLVRLKYGIRPFMGIGNNLFGVWWIEPLVRFNRCFAVIRGVPLHEQLEVSSTLSHYIHYLRDHHHSIWLAQREGRAKDSNDMTQPSVIKMLTIDAPDFFEAVKHINFCPVSISYEYDPCDYLKAQEMQQKRDVPHWHKSKQDDLLSMKTGIEGQKGRVVYRLTPSINHTLEKELEAHPEWYNLNRNEQIQKVCDIIDHQIHAGYEIFERGEEFNQYIDSRIAKIDIPNKDEQFLREKLMEMYENPVINYNKATKEETN